MNDFLGLEIYFSISKKNDDQVFCSELLSMGEIVKLVNGEEFLSIKIQSNEDDINNALEIAINKIGLEQIRQINEEYFLNISLPIWNDQIIKKNTYHLSKKSIKFFFDLGTYFDLDLSIY